MYFLNTGCTTLLFKWIETKTFCFFGCKKNWIENDSLFLNELAWRDFFKKKKKKERGIPVLCTPKFRIWLCCIPIVLVPSKKISFLFLFYSFSLLFFLFLFLFSNKKQTNGDQKEEEQRAQREEDWLECLNQENKKSQQESSIHKILSQNNSIWFKDMRIKGREKNRKRTGTERERRERKGMKRKRNETKKVSSGSINVQRE